MKSKSAVSQILTYLENNKDFNIEDLIKSCKNMLVIEKEQIINAYGHGAYCQGSIDCVLNENLETFSEQYYKQTYE